MSKIQKSFIFLASISMLCWVLANCSSDDSSDSSSSKKKKSSSSSANNTTVKLACTGLQRTVEKGDVIEEPDLTCSNGHTATNDIWNGLPQGNWEVDPNTNAPSFVISVSATCGSVDIEDVLCGTIRVTEAAAGGSSSSATGATLTCTLKSTSVVRGDTIAIPTLACSSGIEPDDIVWNGRPSGNTTWATNPAATSPTSYTISVSAECGGNWQADVRCGTVTVTTPSSSSRGSSSSRAGSSSSRAGSSSSVAAGSSAGSSSGSSAGSSAGGSSSSAAVSSSSAAVSSSSAAVSSSSAAVSSSSSDDGDSSSSVCDEVCEDGAGTGRPWFKLKRR